MGPTNVPPHLRSAPHPAPSNSDGAALKKDQDSADMQRPPRLVYSTVFFSTCFVFLCVMRFYGGWKLVAYAVCASVALWLIERLRSFIGSVLGEK